MSASVPAAASPRRAALMAHALTAADQAWLLGSLPPVRRQVLQGLLTELRELGIPPDDALLEQVRRQPPLAAPPETADARLERLPVAAVSALARLLQREPPTLTARLLGMKPWTWRERLLAGMEQEFARQVRELHIATRAPLLEAALCETLLRQLPAAQPREPALVLGHAWARARALLRRPGQRA